MARSGPPKEGLVGCSTGTGTRRSSVPSGRYSVWCYAHRMTRDSLLAIQNDVVGPKLATEERRISSLVTQTPDYAAPSSGIELQHRLGLPVTSMAFDMRLGCSGFIYALATGAQFVAAGTHKKVLIIGADVMTSIIDFQDRATCVLFGDETYLVEKS